MTRAHRGAISLAVLLATVAASSRARAQAHEPPASVPVEIEAGEPGVTVRVTALGFDLDCGAHCSAELAPRLYRLKTFAPDGRVSARDVLIETPSRLTVTPHSQTARVTGFVLGGVGAGGVGAGLVLLWWAGFKWLLLRMAECDGQCSSDELPGWLVPTGLIALGAGAAIGTTGLLLWRSNAHAAVDVKPLAPPAPRASLRLRPAVGPRWSGLALTAAF